MTMTSTATDAMSLVGVFVSCRNHVRRRSIRAGTPPPTVEIREPDRPRSGVCRRLGSGRVHVRYRARYRSAHLPVRYHDRVGNERGPGHPGPLSISPLVTASW